MMNDTIQPQLLPEGTDLAPIERGLRRLFDEVGHRIVFWHDADGEFGEAVKALSLPEVTLLHLDAEPSLGVKIRLERDDPHGRYLLYAPFAVPAPESDWLLDIRLYSANFQADRASMLLDQLGLGASQSLRPHLNARLKFFNKADRVQRLGKLTQPTDDANDLDRKMLAVLARADHPEPFHIITTIFHDMANAGGLEATPACWDEIEKFGLLPAFWDLAERAFGYTEATPRLRNLLLRLLVTDFAYACHAPTPVALEHLALPPEFRSDVAVCLNQWRDSTARGSSYDRLAGAVAALLKMRDLLGPLSPEALLDVMTFQEVEQHIIAALRDRLIATVPTPQPDNLKALCARRQDGHWASPNLPSGPVPRHALYAAYCALLAAADLFAAVAEGAPAFSDASAAYRAYETGLYRVDQRYRHCCENAAIVRAEGWDLLKALCERVEDAYGIGFLTPLGVGWSALVEQELARQWQIEGIPNQYGFYQSQVKKVLDSGEVKRVFVIISDAFRYEAAQELTTELNSKYRFQATLSSQLGVLPSYTALGMAALLPHGTLSYNAKGEVFADGHSTAGRDNRSKLLQPERGLVVNADDLMKLNRDAGRALIRDSAVVYIYHDAIDAVGDHSGTEDNTFRAVRTAIEELGKLVKHIVNRLNGAYILVTADHGFLYQERAPDLTHKSALEDKPTGTVLAKKRYLIGHHLPPHDKTHRGSTTVTAHTTPGEAGAMDFWVPRSINRFHFTGGAKYLHGGAMPQEIVVPIIKVREREGSAAVNTRVRAVPVHVIGTNLKVTTNRYRAQLIQTEAVTERIQPVTLQIAIYDGDTPVSSLETVTFDSASALLDDRKKSVILSLQSVNYDKNKPYALILRNAEDNIEVQRVEVTIDLAFSSDF